MNMSDQINEVSAALAKAQGEIKNPGKNSMNPHFKNRYADLSAGLDSVRAALSKNGVAIIQATEAEGDAVTLHTRLLHSSGQWIGSTYPVCRVGKHQEMGSALTYARRYTLFSLVGIAGDDDDDGEAAGEATPRQVRSVPKPDPVPSYEPEESASRRVQMVGAIDGCHDRAALHTWAQENSPIKARLTPPDQAIVSKAFADRQKAIKENPPATELLAAG